MPYQPKLASKCKCFCMGCITPRVVTITKELFGHELRGSLLNEFVFDSFDER